MSNSANLRKKLLQTSMSGGRPPIFPGSSRLMKKTKDFSPLKWNQFYQSREIVKTSDNNEFMVYKAGFQTTNNDDQRPVVVLLHGGGFSALTWAVMTSNLVEKVDVGIVGIDLRGHGETKTENDLDLSIGTLASDVIDVLKKLFEEDNDERLGKPRTYMLVGHSMGGAVAVHVALKGELHLGGVCVIDVVEGTAIDALNTMPVFLRSRPSKFNTLSQAIEWSLKTGQSRNLDSARVSMPGQLKSLKTQLCATNNVEEESSCKESSNIQTITFGNNEVITEDEETESSNPQETKKDEFKSPQPKEEVSGYTWRIDLTLSEPHWHGWFTNMSSNFLSIPTSKLLLLAGVDRLDRELTIGQMQGKFQMHVLDAGHSVQEDVPDKVADILAAFLVRNRLANQMNNYQSVFPSC